MQFLSGLWSLALYSLPSAIMICYPAPPKKRKMKIIVYRSQRERERERESWGAKKKTKKILFWEREVMGNPTNTERKAIGTMEV
jgi:hypothetical protein